MFLFLLHCIGPHQPLVFGVWFFTFNVRGVMIELQNMFIICGVYVLLLTVFYSSFLCTLLCLFAVRPSYFLRCKVLRLCHGCKFFLCSYLLLYSSSVLNIGLCVSVLVSFICMLSLLALCM
jgi:hypothetical protein